MRTDRDHATTPTQRDDRHQAGRLDKAIARNLKELGFAQES
jgi:hypothetical protein